MRAPVLMLAVLSLASVGCLGPPAPLTMAGEGETLPGDSPFAVSLIDAGRFGFELGLVPTAEGTIFVCSLRGVGSGTNLWVSRDEGASFDYVGIDPAAGISSYAPVLRSGTGDVGGGDCDMAVDAGGRVYLADLWAGGVSVVSSADGGATWRGVPLSVLAAPVDRPWIVGGEEDEVFVTAAQLQGSGFEDKGLDMPPVGGIWVARSTDGGLTFPQSVMAVSNGMRIGHNSNLALGADHLYLAYGKKVGEGRFAVMVATSGDRGKTWEQHVVAEHGIRPGVCLSPFNIFPAVAADDAGGVYLAWALQNPETERSDLFMASSPDGGATWNTPVLVTDRPGTRVYPWIAAQGSDRVGLVWYETNETALLEEETPVTCAEEVSSEAAWHLHYAFSANALDAAPTFAETLVQEEPIHLGELGRPYAEVLQMRFTPDGRAVTAYVADVPEGRARPMFAIQAAST